MFADGRLVERTADGKTSEDRLGADRLAAVRRALAATDWGALPAGSAEAQGCSRILIAPSCFFWKIS